jgi:hypothetical protein
MKEVEARIPLIMKLLRYDEHVMRYTAVGKAPPQQWDRVQAKLDEATDEHLSLGQVVQRTSIPSGVFGRFISRSEKYLLVSPSMTGLMKSLNMNRNKGVLPLEYMYTRSASRGLLSFRPKERPFDRIFKSTNEVFGIDWYLTFRQGIPQKWTRAAEIALISAYQHYRIEAGMIIICQVSTDIT